MVHTCSPAQWLSGQPSLLGKSQACKRPYLKIHSQTQPCLSAGLELGCGGGQLWGPFLGGHTGGLAGEPVTGDS